MKKKRFYDREDAVKAILKKMKEEHLDKVAIIEWLTDADIWDSPYAESTARAYIKDADEYITDLYRDMACFTLNDCLTAMSQDRQAALKAGNYTLAFNIQREINKVAGLYKERIDINHEVTFKTKWGGS